MIIGVPKEIKNNENRVGMTPSGVAELVKRGHTVYIQHTIPPSSQMRFHDLARYWQPPSECPTTGGCPSGRVPR